MARSCRVVACSVMLVGATACGSSAGESVELPGVEGAPREIVVNQPPPVPTVATPSVVTTEAPAAPSSSTTTELPDASGEAPTSNDVETTSDEATSGDAETSSDGGGGEPADEEPEADPEPDPPADDVFLRRGDSGPEVESLQQRLIVLEYLAPGGDSGVFDDATADALIDFQAQYGLIVDGIFGPESDRALNAAAASVEADG